MFAGTDRTDITPSYSVWMDGMIRDHKSEGVHDPIYVHTVVISNDKDANDCLAIISLDVCVIGTPSVNKAKELIYQKSGISLDRVVIAATHSHSGPAALGIFQEMEERYVDDLILLIAGSVARAKANIRPALVSCCSGREETISHYRRFTDADGKIVMFWEQDPAEGKIHALGEPDPEVGVMKIIDPETNKPICVLFNHAGHPNVMSGDNYMISGDYTGAAARIVSERLGCEALFVNGAQGSVDMDNWRFRDWAAVELLGSRLAEAVIAACDNSDSAAHTKMRFTKTNYTLPRRKVTDQEIAWADEVLKQTSGQFAAAADGVGDDYKAAFCKKIRALQNQDIDVEQVAFSIGDTAYISFPGELFTEVGLRIKSRSPFRHTYIIGLANGYVGYVPTREAISQGGYEVETRHVDEKAALAIEDISVKLLNELSGGKNV
ncbi:neutral/alkaline non-lysosomal ceramidase N-terminal domain-containing protein [bacterium]|nr:neutral/alkaline non-lysosomal ceramidase N-terminal domain-containing protein [bacterium]